MRTAGTVEILIVHLEGYEILSRCLASLFAQPAECQFTVRVLLNGNREPEAARLHREYPRVQVRSTPATLGFAAAANLLAKQASGEFLLFLNNDVTVTEGWLDELLATLRRNPGAIACQPRVRAMREPRFFEYAGAAGGFLDIYGYPFCKGRIFTALEEDLNQYSREERIFWGCGVCLMVICREFLALGGFDESYYMYGEELNFCWQANLAGKEIWYCPGAVIYHLGSYSINSLGLNRRKNFLIVRNHLLLILTNYSLYSLMLILPLRLCFELLAAIRFAPVGIIALLTAVWHILTKDLYCILRKRKQLQSLRKVGDGALRKLMSRKSIVLGFFLFRKTRFSDYIQPGRRA